MTIHSGATLTPPFRDFVPLWLSRQPWYQGGAPTPAGFFRFEDPAGEVGIETHVLSVDGVTYQIPMTYRGAPLAGGNLITTAEHSVLGPRWIYDAESDPVWRKELLGLVRSNGVATPSRESEFEARGVLLTDFADDEVDIELARIVAGDPPDLPTAVGVVTSDAGWLAMITRR